MWNVLTREHNSTHNMKALNTSKAIQIEIANFYLTIVKRGSLISSELCLILCQGCNTRV